MPGKQDKIETNRDIIEALIEVSGKLTVSFISQNPLLHKDSHNIDSLHNYTEENR